MQRGGRRRIPIMNDGTWSILRIGGNRGEGNFFDLAERGGVDGKEGRGERLFMERELSQSHRGEEKLDLIERRSRLNSQRGPEERRRWYCAFDDFIGGDSKRTGEEEKEMGRRRRRGAAVDEEEEEWIDRCGARATDWEHCCPIWRRREESS